MKKFIFLFIIFFSFNVFSQQKIEDFYLSNFKEGSKKDWEINGKNAVVEDKYVNINKMEAKYYSNNTVMEVKSDKAKFNKENFNAKLEDNVEVKFPVDKGYTTITCEGPLEIEYQKGLAVFNKNVVVENPDGKLFCNIAEVYFDVENKKLIKIIAKENVKIVQNENAAFSNQAIYFADTRKIVLEGNPKIVYFPKEKNEDIRSKKSF